MAAPSPTPGAAITRLGVDLPWSRLALGRVLPDGKAALRLGLVMPLITPRTDPSVVLTATDDCDTPSS